MKRNETMENSKIISFLRTLADSLEKDELSEMQINRLGEFFMSYQFQEAAEEDNNNQCETFKEEDLNRFVFLGWYIYSIILKNETL